MKGMGHDAGTARPRIDVAAPFAVDRSGPGLRGVGDQGLFPAMPVGAGLDWTGVAPGVESRPAAVPTKRKTVIVLEISHKGDLPDGITDICAERAYNWTTNKGVRCDVVAVRHNVDLLRVVEGGR